MSGSDSRAALVPVHSAALAVKGSAALARRGLSDLDFLESAESWFKKARELYDAVPKEYSAAQFRSSLGEFFKCLQRAATLDPNHPGIQSWLGAAYKSGLGTQTDFVAAANCFRKAANEGIAAAQYELAEMYLFGEEGVPQDSSEAMLLYEKASVQGHIDSQIALGVACMDFSGDAAKSTAWFRRAAEQGSSIGQCFLGEALEEGWGVEKDPVEASSWYRKAAEQGQASAQYKLGLMYKKGDGVEKNLDEAFRWFRRSSEQGYSPAHFQLGHMYLYGSWLPKNYAKAAEHLHKAAEPKDGSGDRELGSMMLAQLDLSHMYRNGYGVERSAALSQSWFRRSQATERQLSKHKI